jgi:hypothetical protein
MTFEHAGLEMAKLRSTLAHCSRTGSGSIALGDRVSTDGRRGQSRDGEGRHSCAGIDAAFVATEGARHLQRKAPRRDASRGMATLPAPSLHLSAAGTKSISIGRLGDILAGAYLADPFPLLDI